MLRPLELIWVCATDAVLLMRSCDKKRKKGAGFAARASSTSTSAMGISRGIVDALAATDLTSMSSGNSDDSIRACALYGSPGDELGSSDGG